jgi:hypothetical protein
MSWIVDAICAHFALSLPHHPCPIATASFAINAVNSLCCSQRRGSAAKPKASSQKQGSCPDAPSVKHWWEFGRKDIIGCFLSRTPPPWRIRHVFWPARRIGGRANRRRRVAESSRKAVNPAAPAMPAAIRLELRNIRPSSPCSPRTASTVLSSKKTARKA